MDYSGLITGPNKEGKKMRHIESGAGFWNVEHYPRGGDFGRAFKDRPLTCELIPASYESHFREWKVKLLEDCGHHKAGDSVMVNERYLSVEL